MTARLPGQLPVLPAEAPAREIVRNYPWPGYALWRGHYWRMGGGS